MITERPRGIAGVLVDGTFWFWSTMVTPSTIALRRSTNSSRAILHTMAIILAIAGVVGFVLDAVFYSTTELLTSVYWSTPHISLAGLALGILSFCFAGYVRKQTTDALQTLPRVENIAELSFVSDPAALSHHRHIEITGTEDLHECVETAFTIAARGKHAQVGPVHFFVSVTASSRVRLLLARLGVHTDALRDPLRRHMTTVDQGETEFGEPASDLIANAFLQAVQHGAEHFTPIDLCSAAVEADEFLQELFLSQGIGLEEFKNAVTWMRIQDDLRVRYTTFRKAASFKPTSNMNRAYTAVATPFLEGVSEDLTKASVDGRTTMMIGRAEDMTRILRAFESGTRGVILVGAPGVGKQAIIEGLADRMVEERVPALLEDKRLLRLSIPHIVSAQGGRGAEERFLYALQEVGNAGNVVVVLEDVQELVGTGTGVELAAILAGELEKGYLTVIATTTPEAYAEQVERSALGSKLMKLVIDEPDRTLAIRIAESHTLLWEGKNNVIFTYAALAACVDLSMRYIHDGVLPEKALNLGREVALACAGTKGKAEWILKEDVAKLVGEKTKIPVTEVTADEGEKLLHLESRIHERVIGQEPAIKAVASALRRARTELRATNKPIASFLFLGPTGVGKTELAKATAEVFFGNENVMVRFDMSEYQDAPSLARLIGGNGQAGQLTEAVRKMPFALVLLDELEKAHPDILNVFLQVMDDGRLTDGLGRTIDFTNTIIIATSNAGTQFIEDEIATGKDIAEIKLALVENELKKFYRPEFLNRFNEIIVFAPLTQDDVAAIAYLFIAKIIDRLKAKGITLTVTDSAVHELAQPGYDKKFGARPLRRTLEERVENVIADQLLKGEVSRRDTIILDMGGKIEVVKAKVL